MVSYSQSFARGFTIHLSSDKCHKHSQSTILGLRHICHWDNCPLACSKVVGTKLKPLNQFRFYKLIKFKGNELNSGIYSRSNQKWKKFYIERDGTISCLTNTNIISEARMLTQLNKNNSWRN